MKTFSLSKFKNLVFDLDGVIYLGDKLIPNIDKTIQKLYDNGFEIFFLTNNATSSRRQILLKLNSLGLNKIKKENIVSSAYAAACFVNKNKFRQAFVIGEEGLKEELRNFGINILDPEKIEQINENNTCLVSGLDRDFHYKKLKQAINFLLTYKNVKWVACNLDPTFPIEKEIAPGAGSIAASIAFSLGKLNKNKMVLKHPDFVVGKPSLYMLDLLFDKSERKNSIFIGDRLDIDIPFAKKAGLFSVLVLSGIAKKEDIKKYKIKPDLVLDSASSLEKFL